MKPTKETIIRVTLAAIALINAVAAMCGVDKLLNIDGTTIGAIYDGVSALALAAATIWAAWKNNSFTVPAITADNVLRLLEQGEALLEAAKTVDEETKAE